MVFKNKRQLLSAFITKNDVVLDIGFLGQGIQDTNPEWPHAILKNSAKEVFGIDCVLPPPYLSDTLHYKQGMAEEVSFDRTFDSIFAGDVIEHMVNPGLFLQNCRRMLRPEGMLILTTPNTFNLFNLAEKITKQEPTVNSDHTMYFNHKVMNTLLEKCNFTLDTIAYLYSLELGHKESWKKHVLNFLYATLGLTTEKFMETLVIVARPRRTSQHSDQ